MVGSRRVALSRDGLLRLVPGHHGVASPARFPQSIPRGTADSGRLVGALVLLGGSAPELGGLRKNRGPADASVQIQADAVEQLLAGRVPRILAAAQSRSRSRSW